MVLLQGTDPIYFFSHPFSTSLLFTILPLYFSFFRVQDISGQPQASFILLYITIQELLMHKLYKYLYGTFLVESVVKIFSCKKNILYFDRNISDWPLLAN